MKRNKLLSMLLVLAMCISLCACGGGSESTDKSNSVWNIEQSTDEFGDITEDSAMYITGAFDGTFSNTATADGELTVVANFIKKSGYNHYIASFDLKEYNDANATFYSDDTITFKMKVGEEVIEDTMTGKEPNGSLCLGEMEYSWGGDLLYNALYDGNDVKCIVTIGSSEYNFTLNSDNFQELCNENGYGIGAGELTLKEAVKIFLDDAGTSITYTQDWFINNIEKMELMSEADMKTFLEGNFLEISVESYTPDPITGEYYFPHWYVYNYSVNNNCRDQIADYTFNDDVASAFANSIEHGVNAYADGFRKYSTPLVDTPSKLTIQNDTLIHSYENSSYVFEYQCRKITDDCFMLCMKYDDGVYYPSSLLFRCDGATQEDIHNAVAYANEVILNQIEK